MEYLVPAFMAAGDARWVIEAGTGAIAQYGITRAVGIAQIKKSMKIKVLRYLHHIFKFEGTR